MSFFLAAAAIIAPIQGLGNSSVANAMHIAHLVGEYAGYTPNKLRKIDYDLGDDPSRPAYPGFVTIQILTGAQSVFDLSIDPHSGRVFDFLNCLVFEYPVLYHRSPRLAWPSRRAVYDKAMAQNGCDSYQILRRRGDEGRRLRVHQVP
jgi:hypothetical protein